MHEITLHETVTPAALEYAIWVIGGYPQVGWDDALARVIAGIRELGFNEIRPSTIWLLGRKVAGREFAYIDLQSV